MNHKLINGRKNANWLLTFFKSCVVTDVKLVGMEIIIEKRHFDRKWTAVAHFLSNVLL